MARKPSRVQAPASSHRPPEAASPAWADWFGGFQAIQVHAVRDMLAVCNRYAAALAASRDAQALMIANQAAMSDWVACIDGVQHEWLALAKAVPADALAAAGWRLKPGAGDPGSAKSDDGEPDLFKQSWLGVEMLLRPWMPTPDLDHTDEFVA